MTGIDRLYWEEREEAVKKATEEVKSDDWKTIYENCLLRGMTEEQARDLADCLKK